jgi:putative membrane protein
LEKYISPDELKYILTTKNKATQLMSLQSKTIKELFAKKEIDSYQFVEMQRMVKDFYDQQGKSERIKNFPYPRQFATINSLFIKLFCILLPFGMLKDFDKLNDSVEGILKGNMVWLTIPFSVLISWVYTSLEQVGESTENPFEGSANDVPISQMSRTIEIDMREMLGETDLPPALQAKNNIIEPKQVMLADSICSDDVNSIQYPVRTQEFLGPFKMGGLDGFPFTGLTGMGAFASHVPDDGAVFIYYGTPT